MWGDPRKRSIATRLFISSGVLSVAILLVAGLILTAVYRNSTEAAFDERLGVYLRALVADLAADRPSDDKPADLGLADPQFELTLSGWYWQVTRLDGPKQDIRASRSLFASRLPRLADSGVPGRDGRRAPRLRQRSGRSVAAHRRAGDRYRRQRDLPRPGRGDDAGDRCADGALRVRSPGHLLHARRAAGRVVGGAAALRPAAAAPPPGRRVVDPARRAGEDRGRLSRRHRAAGERAQPHDLGQPRGRRARPDPGRQLGARAEDAAQRHHQRGDGGTRAVRRQDRGAGGGHARSAPILSGARPRGRGGAQDRQRDGGDAGRPRAGPHVREDLSRPQPDLHGGRRRRHPLPRRAAGPRGDDRQPRRQCREMGGERGHDRRQSRVPRRDRRSARSFA